MASIEVGPGNLDNRYFLVVCELGSISNGSNFSVGHPGCLRNSFYVRAVLYKFNLCYNSVHHCVIKICSFHVNTSR